MTAPWLTRARVGASAPTGEEIFAKATTRDEAREAVARRHWFDDWAAAAPRAGAVVDPLFERAAA